MAEFYARPAALVKKAVGTGEGRPSPLRGSVMSAGSTGLETNLLAGPKIFPVPKNEKADPL